VRDPDIPLERHCAVLIAVGIAALTILMLWWPHALDLDNVQMLYLLVVVIASMLTTRTAAVAAAVVCWLLVGHFFTPTVQAMSLGHDRLVELTVLLTAAVLVNLVVGTRTKYREAALRREREVQLLADLASISSHELSAVAVLRQVRAVLGMSWVRLLRPHASGPARPIAQVGAPHTAPRDFSIDAANGLRLEGGWQERGVTHDERIRHAIADAVAHLWNEQQVSEELAQARRLADRYRLRDSLLAAVSHDLRNPLASIKANASALRDPDNRWPDTVQDELLAGIEESADQLTDMVSNLLAMSRLRTGTLRVHLSAVPLYEVVSRALASIGDNDTVMDVAEQLPPVRADRVLLERVVANLVMNAHQHGGSDQPVTLRAAAKSSGVEIAVIDHGPGVEKKSWEEIFRPFQRLGDARRGVGLGLAIARGFSEAMSAEVRPSHTPGGGLTMTLTLPRAR
jgi:two-component system sensor histidine kinase KdpD